MKKYLAAAVVAAALIVVPSASATVSCTNAGNYAGFVSYNEALYILNVSSGLNNTVTWLGYESCFTDAANNRTQIIGYYKGVSSGGNRYLRDTVYVYDRFDCNPNCHSPDLGNVTWQYQSANGVPLSSGTYATPGE